MRSSGATAILLVLVGLVVTACQSPPSGNLQQGSSAPTKEYTGLDDGPSDEALADLPREEREVARRERARKRFPELVARLDMTSERIAKSAIQSCVKTGDAAELIALLKGNSCIFRAIARNMSPAEPIERICGTAPDLEAFSDCAVMGVMNYQVRRALGEPSPEAGWSVDESLDEQQLDKLARKWLIECASNTALTVMGCMAGKMAGAFDVSHNDVAYCESKPEAHQMDCMTLAAAIAVMGGDGKDI